MFRRRTSDDSETSRTANGSTAVRVTAAEPGSTAGAPTVGKGRPTPKRSEAEANRAARLNPPKDRREALKQQRARAKADRLKSRSALMGGDERYMTTRDRGPLRRFVRDYIDSRRTIGEYFLFIGLGIALLSFVNSTTVVAWAFSAWFALIVLMIGEGFWISTRLRRELAARFPEQKGPHQGRKGAVFYGLLRAFQLRRLRLPKPQVKPGATV